MALLWAVRGDENTHTAGALETNIGDNSVMIGGFPVTVIGDDAQNTDGSLHANSKAQTGSGTVFCYGVPIHRHTDLRDCGATTVVTHQLTVFSD